MYDNEYSNLEEANFDRAFQRIVDKLMEKKKLNGSLSDTPTNTGPTYSSLNVSPGANQDTTSLLKTLIQQLQGSSNTSPQPGLTRQREELVSQYLTLMQMFEQLSDILESMEQRLGSHHFPAGTDGTNYDLET